MFGLVTASCQKWPPVLPSIRLPERKNPQRSQGFARGSGEMDSTWKTYPRADTARQAMADDHYLPGKISSIYQEVIGAMNAQLPVLAAIGLWALIEAICRERNIASGNLEKLIDGLATRSLSDLGNARPLRRFSEVLWAKARSKLL